MRVKYIQVAFLLAVTLLVLVGCNYFENAGEIQNVGMLTDGSIDDPLAEKGYQGLKEIEETYEVDVYYEENVRSEQEVRNAVAEYVQDGVNLIFGQSSSYGNSFAELSTIYPDVHFVYFNGAYVDDNVTSMNFNSHAMGFFAGMVAARASSNNDVGIIAAFEWQPEIEGFFEGVNYQNPSTEVHINFVNDWHDSKTAMDAYREMRENGVDVFYPVGDAFSEEIVRQAAEDELYAIGYVRDQSDIGGERVLTSTVQHVDKLYVQAAEQFNNGELSGSVMTFDFRDDVISLGEFSPNVPPSYQEMLSEEIEDYKETGLLPNQE